MQRRRLGVSKDLTKIEISEFVKVESSNINMVGFEKDTTYVQFKNGSIYSYPETSQEEFERLSQAKSVGKYFALTYRNKENYNKLEDTILMKREEEKVTRSDTEILLWLLNSLTNLDTHSADEAIVHFENMIQQAAKEVGYDRLNEWVRQDIGPEKYDALLEEVKRQTSGN
jgi:hypothetical protein